MKDWDDLRFFLAVAPEHQAAEHDNREAIAHEWVRPEEALERYRRKEIKLRTPTIKTLELFAGFSDVNSILAALRVINLQLHERRIKAAN